MREIEENKTYRHFKGNVYKVLFYGTIIVVCTLREDR